MTAVTVVGRNQARAAGGFVAMEGNRFAVDFHGGVAFNDHCCSAMPVLGAGNLVAYTGGGLAINQVVALGGDHFAAVVCSITEYDDSFHLNRSS